MPKSKRNAAGSGTIRKKTVLRNGKEYTYWEARYTEGFDPGTGKQIQRSVSGKTQKEVAQKLKAATAAIDAGTYIAPSKMTVGEWLDIWQQDYLGSVKPRTLDSHRTTVDTHLKPAFGAIKLDALATHEIQRFYNNLQKEQVPRQPLSPKTIRNIHGLLSAVLREYYPGLQLSTTLPQKALTEQSYLEPEQIGVLLRAVRGNELEIPVLLALWLSLRSSEVTGLTWDCVDFERSTITVRQARVRDKNNRWVEKTTKTTNSTRTISAPPYIMEVLKAAKEDAGPEDHVVTIKGNCLYQRLKVILKKNGLPDIRFHDLRHPNVYC